MKISVLINTRNHGDYLRECVESVLAQTRPADEIIVCDDGGTDGTAALLAGYTGRIVVLQQRHEPTRPGYINQARAIEAAFRISTGDVILLLDGDDTFAPERVERYAAAFAVAPAPVLVQSPLAIIDAHGRVSPAPHEPRRHQVAPLATAMRTHALDLFYPTSALGFSRAFLERALPLSFDDGIPLWADVRLCLAALLAGPVVTLPDTLGRWRRLESGATALAVRDRFYLVRLTWQQAKVFNALATAAGQPRISLWRSQPFYLRLGYALAPWRGRVDWRAVLARRKMSLRWLKPLWAGWRTAAGALPWRWLPGSSRGFGPPRGLTRTTVEYLRLPDADPADRHISLSPEVEYVRPAPLLAAGTAPEKFSRLARETVPAADVFLLHGVRFWGDYAGTLIGRNDHVLGDLTVDIWGLDRHKIFTRIKLPRVRELPGLTAILATAEADINYYHWTIDLLPRIGRIQAAGVSLESIDWFVVNHRDQRWQRETLAELGVPWEKVIRADAAVHLACERVVTTSLRGVTTAVPAADYDYLQSRASASAAVGGATRRIHVSRRGASFRRVTNEAEVSALLARHGFEEILGGQLSVAEQRRCFREAAVVVGVHGAAMTNLVYCEPGTRVLEFFAPDYVSLEYWTLASRAGLEYWTLPQAEDAPKEDRVARQADITVDLAALETTLLAMLARVEALR